MITSETFELIRSHAGLNVRDPDGSFVSDALLLGKPVDTPVASLVDAFQRMNIEINGRKPSETVGDDNFQLPVHLVYAVAEVVRMLRDEGFDEHAWAVDTAWLAVLAGDVDDVPDHVAMERLARG